MRPSRRGVLHGLGSTAAMSLVAPNAVLATGIATDPLLASYSMPGEDEPHQRTLMQWPVEVSVYGEHGLLRIQQTIATIANAIVKHEPVAMLMAQEHLATAKQLLSRDVEIWNIATNDLWCRDSGPTFVKNRQGKLAISHIHFNGWGERQQHARDSLIAARVAEHLSLPLLETGLIGEQGAVEHDGAGTLLAHASCWVNSSRSDESGDVIGERLMKSLGGKKLIWAPGLKDHDITDFHIDALARFVAPGKVLIQLPKMRDDRDPYARAAYQTYDILKSATDASGKTLELVVLPDPVDIRSNRRDFVSSYVNFYLCNDAVIMPEFGDAKADARAQAIISEFYAGRKILALNVDPLGEAGGGIHCATQQQPQTHL